jgi:hypothetical protein
MAWAKNGTPATGSGGSLTISDLTTLKFNQIMSHLLPSGDLDSRLRLGSNGIDTDTNYADRLNFNGGGDFTQISQNDIHLINTATPSGIFVIAYIINIASQEKLVIHFSVASENTGSGIAPDRMEGVNKWANTTTQFDNVQVMDEVGTQIGADSNLSALGTD